MELEEAESRVNEMVSAEYCQWGDMVNAVSQVSKDCKLGYWTIENIRKRRAKSPAYRVLDGIKRGYLVFCERQIASYHQKLEEARRTGNDVDEILLGEIEVLLSKIKAKNQANE